MRNEGQHGIDGKCLTIPRNVQSIINDNGTENEEGIFRNELAYLSREWKSGDFQTACFHLNPISVILCRTLTAMVI
jgi:hypothetical protein